MANLKESPKEGGIPDYRVHVLEALADFLKGAGLRASVFASGWDADGTPVPHVIVWVWRHDVEKDCLGSMEENEVDRIAEILRSETSPAIAFSLQDRLSLEHFGQYRVERKLVFRDGVFTVSRVDAHP